MLEKVNQLNKNVVILLSVLIFAVTSIVITLLIIGGSSNSEDIKSINDFEKAFESQYGVKPNISISVHGASEAQAQQITDSVSSKLKLGDAKPDEYRGMKWYETRDEKRGFAVSVFYK